ncbi:MAG TPA: alpha-isopropylmalate synthase regulatory domain-containing protein, partial [Nitrospiria bacterium]|nr:alpha-isopropylmalate synthase regulatory domain-containing protein [Nitrospiria bacterium]
HLADQKKELFEEDLDAIVAEEVFRIPERYRLVAMQVESGTGTRPTATVELEIDGHRSRQTGHGDGPVDAAYRTIAAMIATKSCLQAYIVKAITGGTDAQGEVTVRVEEDGRTAIGQGADTDIIIASAKAYLNALNKLAYWQQRGRIGVLPSNDKSHP